jgi:N-dimethylarginine dimethylaminohydrolase
MRHAARYLMTDPAHYAVSYSINPWMRPDLWEIGAEALGRRARAASRDLASALRGLGAAVDWVAAEPGLPDLVFPANAAVVLDGRALMARFRWPERRGEEPAFRRAFDRLVERGLLKEVVELPEGLFHEGAGDAIWDARRSLVWTGWGPRSDRAASDAIAETFGVAALPLRLATDRYYHLDTCFCPLAGGEVLYYPPAFTPEALGTIRERVAPGDLIEASDEDAAAFCVNAISLGRDIVMAQPPAALRARLEARGYRVHGIDLSPFILSGGGAFCMTLRLDLTSQATELLHDRHPDIRAIA